MRAAAWGLAVVLMGCAGEIRSNHDGGAALDGGADARPGDPVCGNRVVEAGEDCDDGNDATTDGCIACSFASCGDGALRARVEECDDDSATCHDCMACDVFVGGHCYERLDALLTQAQAADACGARGGYLAAIEGDSEWSGVAAALWADPFPGTWLGLRRAMDGVDAWVWGTGDALVTPRWRAGEPNDAGGVEDCVEASAADGLWNDVACDGARPYLCERDPWAIDPATNHAYRVVHRARTWVEATNDCAALGAHLVVITDEQEQAFVAALARTPVWTGAFQGPGEVQFSWVTGDDFDYDNFGAGQPDDAGGNEDCVELLADGTWNDRSCVARLAPLCEID